MIECKICKRELKSLKSLARHLYHSHSKITIKQYYDDYLKHNDEEGVCIICGRITKFSGLRYGYQTHCSKSCAQNDPELIKKRNINRKLRLGIDLNENIEPTICKCGCGLNTKHTNSLYCKGHANRDINVKQKKIDSSKLHYGCDNPFQSDKIKKKIINTNLRKYGTENPFQCGKVKDKYNKTCLQNFGVEWSMQSEEIREKSKHTNMKNYGVDNFAKTPQGREISRKNFIRMIENEKLNGETLCGRVGDMERQCFNELEKHIDYKIIRNTQIIGYIPDGYIPELNLLIEFDERHHFVDNYQTYCDRDIQKDKDYNRAGFNFIRIKKNEWIGNPEQVITKFKNMSCQMLTF